MNSVLTALLWLGYLVLMVALKVVGGAGFLPVFGVAVVWTLIIAGLRKILVPKPTDR